MGNTGKLEVKEEADETRTDKADVTKTKGKSEAVDFDEIEDEELQFGRERNSLLPPLEFSNSNSNIENYTLNSVTKPIMSGQKISISKPSTSSSQTKPAIIIPTSNIGKAREKETGGQGREQGGRQGRTREKETGGQGGGQGGGKYRKPTDFLSNYTSNLGQLPIVQPKGLVISAWSDEELRKKSVVTVTDFSSSYGNHTVNDPRLGVIDSRDKCATCGLNKDCPGHYGMINIEKAMVLNPLFIEIICMVLGSVCNSCGTIKISKENIRLHGINSKTGYNRLRAIYDITKDLQTCAHSFEGVSLDEDEDVNNILSPESRAIIAESENAANNSACKLNPILSITESKSSGRIQYKIEKKGKGMSMTNEDVFSILSSISNSDSKLLGFIDVMRPRDLIIRSLPVIPVRDRPPSFTSKGRNDNFITSQYIKILKTYNTIINGPKSKSKHVGDRDKEIEKSKLIIQDLIKQIVDNPDSENHGNSKGIKQLVNGKEGAFRMNIQGKRVNYSARSVIGPDMTLEFGQARIPKAVATTETVKVVVTVNNIEMLVRMLKAGKINYVEKPSGRKIRIKDDSRYSVVIEVGDVVYRHLMNGDIAVLNRQPTLHRQGIMGMDVVIGEQNSIGLNLLSTTPMNADFDGDEANIHVPQTEEAQKEARTIMHQRSCLMSGQTNRPMVGEVLNTVVGSFDLTNNETFINVRNWSDYMLVLHQKERSQLVDLEDRLDEFNMGRRIINKNGEEIVAYPGKALFSAVLPRDFYYDHGGVLIQKGVLLDGIVRKSHIGTAYNAMHQYMDMESAANFLSDLNIIVNIWQSREHPVTVGLEECFNTDPFFTRKIKSIVDRARRDAIVLGVDPEDPFELERRNRDKLIIMGRAFTETAVLTTDMVDKKSGLYRMNKSGAKGADFNLAQVRGSVGQQLIKGGLPPRHLNSGARTMAYFRPGELDPRAHGFVPKSFSQGLDVYDFIFHAAGSREGLLDTATKTAVVGQARNEMSKIFENVKVVTDGSIRNESNRLMDYCAWTTGLNPEHLINVDMKGRQISFFVDLNSIAKKINAMYGYY